MWALSHTSDIRHHLPVFHSISTVVSRHAIAIDDNVVRGISICKIFIIITTTYVLENNVLKCENVTIMF